MTITTTTQGAWTVLSLDGKIDNAGSEELKAAVFPLLTGGKVALDCSNVEYVTSSGFRVLMQAEKEQRTKGGSLILGNLTTPVSSFFEIAGLHTLFKIVPDLKAALASS
jgi:anti-sigma B factor antagonist